MIPIFVSAQHDIPYFHWQIELYINNFRNKGIPIENINVILSIPQNAEKPSKGGRNLKNKYKNVYFYKDERDRKNYIPSIKPYLISKWLKDDPERGRCFFLHDSDIIFNYLPDYSELINDRVNYLSDTIGYIGYNYLTNTSENYEKIHSELEKNNLIKIMSKVIGINPKIIEYNQSNAGGAQYLLKNQTVQLWEKIYKDSTKLYDETISFDRKYPIKTGQLQFWTAEMWSILWNLWYFGHSTRISDKMNFSWATDNLDIFENRPIFHLSGVTEKEREKFFYKGDYINKNPIETLIKDSNAFTYIEEKNATNKYIDNIRDFIQKTKSSDNYN